MARVESRSAELAARLARDVGGKGVVCVGCLPAWTTGVVTLSAPPLQEPKVELGSVLLLIACSDVAVELLALAASAAVPEIWLLEKENLLSALSRPVGGLYRRRTLILPGERVRLVALPEVELTPTPAVRS